MAAISASTYPAAGISPFSQRSATSSYGGIRNLSWILAVSKERDGRETGFGENGKHEKQKLNQKVVKEESEVKPNIYANPKKLPEFEEDKKWLKDYFEECKEMIRSDGGPPRWFSHLECSLTSPDCPLLLFLPSLI
ncbi:acyltransferase-like protein chloroplastic [Gossypium australe]|uniref:Acyltransferase-like protein chloroplastic n=1 Tax=Gossypium australe TaxID=47621 RepID=A0A5B6W2H2_9ROSI|nr:acyltransferase-like protein chloroplastic [Gossypium australe]